MIRVHAVVKNGRIDIPVPTELAEGTELVCDLTPASDKIGLDESEWRDDAAALADWTAWLDTIEPIEFAKPGAFEEEFARFNVEAVRKQMFGDGQ